MATNNTQDSSERRTAGSLERVVMLTKMWREQAANLRKQSPRTLKAAGISKAMRDYGVARYEDSADEVERAIRGEHNDQAHL